MGTFKVRVNTLEESKEIQNILESIGFSKWDAWSESGSIGGFIWTNSDMTFCDNKIEYFDESPRKEITLAELRDMVVLKRNDKSDRNVVDLEYPHVNLYLDSNNNLFVFHIPTQTWIVSKLNCVRKVLARLKPIEKNMKEYLDKQEDGTYKLITASGGCVDRDWIEVPEGAVRARFYPHDPDELEFENSNHQWWNGENKDWAYYSDYAGSVQYSRVVWRRTPSLKDRYLEQGKKLNDACASVFKKQDDLLTTMLDHSTMSINDQYAEIEQVRQTLNERQSQYGSFKDVADTTAVFMDQFALGRMSNVQREALHMICSKLARIANGDPSHVDSWHDIAGYATLVVDDLES